MCDSDSIQITIKREPDDDLLVQGDSNREPCYGNSFEDNRNGSFRGQMDNSTDKFSLNHPLIGNNSMENVSETLSLKMEPADSSCLVNDHHSDAQDCNYGDMYQIKANVTQTQDCNYGDMYQIKASVTQTQDCNYGDMYQIEANATDTQDTAMYIIQNVDETITKNQFKSTSNLPVTSTKYFDEKNHEIINANILTKQPKKTKNRRKRTETVRRLKVNETADDGEEFLDGSFEYGTESNETDPAIDTFECSDCQEVFNSLKKLKSHQKKCSTEEFKTFDVHLPKKKTKSSNMCEICGKMFMTKKSLDRHGVVHSGSKPFQCHVCERSYTQNGHLQLHMKMHVDADEEFECEYCFKVAQRRDKYIYHNKFHERSKDIPYLCNACGSQFREKAELVEHVRLHRIQRNTELYFIREFKTKKSGINVNENKRKNDQDAFLLKKPSYNNLHETDYLNEDKMVKEEKFDSYLYICQLCKKEFADFMCLQEHLCRHSGESFNIKCETCDQFFDKKSEFLKHQDEHATESSIKCDICGKYLFSQTDMARHRNFHNIVSSLPRGEQSTHREMKMVVELNEQNLDIVDIDGRIKNKRSFTQGSFDDLSKKSKVLQTDGMKKDSIFKYGENASEYQGEEVHKFESDQSSSMFDGSYQSMDSIIGMQSVEGDGRLEQNLLLKDQPSENLVDLLVEKNAMETNIKSVLNNTSKSGRFSCNVCNMEFTKINLLRLHAFFCGNKQEKIKVRSYGKRKEFECPVCRKVFSDRRGIERHGPVHSGIKAYECGICGRAYTQKGHLELHMKKHNDNFFERFECPFCFRIFEKKDRFVKHKEFHSGPTPYTCNVCNKSVTTLDGLQTHFRSHSHYNFYYVDKKANRKGGPATYNWQVFDHSGNLDPLSSNHLKLFHNEQTNNQFIYVCQICRKEFQSWEILLEHIDRHFGCYSQYRCETCEDEFDSIHNLKQHINEHSDQSEYTAICQVCKKLHKSQEEMNKHFKIHERLSQKRSFYMKVPKGTNCSTSESKKDNSCLSSVTKGDNCLTSVSKEVSSCLTSVSKGDNHLTSEIDVESS